MNLHLHATEAALEVALVQLLGERRERAAYEVGTEMTSVQRLLKEARGRGMTIHPLAEHLLLRDLERGGRAGIARLQPLLAALRRAAVTPGMLRDVAPRLIGKPGGDARWLADVLDRYEARLGERRDEAVTTRDALQAIVRGEVELLAGVELVIVAAAPLDPLERAVVRALAQRGIAVRCRVPVFAAGTARGGAAVYEDALEAAVGSALRTLEAMGDSGAGLEAEQRPLGAGPRPSVYGAASPALEAREVARRVFDRVAAGAAPDDIIVVADDRDRRAELARALQRYHVPVEREAPSALKSAAVRVVLAAHRLAGEGFSRDRFVDLLSSRYVAAGVRLGETWIHPNRVARTLREIVPAAADPAGHRVALERWATGQPEPRRAEAAAIARHLTGWLDALAAVPRRATLARHVDALRVLIERLDVFTRARGFRRGTPPAPGSAVADALARDQAALRALADQLDLLPRAATQVGLADRAYERGEVGELLALALSGVRLPNGGGRGAAVRLCSSAALAGVHAPILILTGAEEGALPAASSEDPLLDDDTRRVLDRALDRAIFAPTDLAERRALLAIASARASAQEVLLTWSRADAQGRAKLPGPLVLHARALGAEEQRGPLSPVPALADAREPGELVARLGVSIATQAPVPRLRDALAAHDGPRLLRVERLSAIERGRETFFLRRGTPDRHDGRVSDPAVLAALVAGPLPGGAARPLSASTLRNYLECPARFFLESVLRLRTVEEQGDDLDARADGSLKHLALERLFLRWQSEGLFPLRGTDAERAQLDLALQEAALKWRALQPCGHELVWRARLAGVRRMLEGVWQRELAAQSALVPTHFELSFAGLTVVGDEGEQPLHVTGKIDRVDLGRDDDGAATAVVLDYKSGKMDKLSPELNEAAFGETSWQLPLYAAALRAKHGAAQVEVGYYSLRDLKKKSVPAPAWLVVERGTEAEQTLGDRLLVHARAMRSGHFEVAPNEDACTRCEMQAACRVVERRDEEEVGP